ncbi:MAG: aminotransferase class I/II-fold pyridoxal phosphate-dependent enzyme, partial [Ketobacteraceae bacterium]|nr:aminotransferase class I/II-fold pyridoxal phosphate-dependent enzyme [Ketobacteraceae bacterium]
CSIAQKAAQAALEGPQECVGEMVKAFKERHDFVVNALNAIEGVKCLPGDGTFYAFPDLSEAIAKRDDVNTDVELAEKLLGEAGVAIVPGSAFGTPNHARLSFATSMEKLKEALARLKKGIEGS